MGYDNLSFLSDKAETQKENINGQYYNGIIEPSKSVRQADLLASQRMANKAKKKRQLRSRIKAAIISSVVGLGIFAGAFANHSVVKSRDESKARIMLLEDIRTHFENNKSYYDLTCKSKSDFLRKFPNESDEIERFCAAVDYASNSYFGWNVGEGMKRDILYSSFPEAYGTEISMRNYSRYMRGSFGESSELSRDLRAIRRRFIESVDKIPYAQSINKGTYCMFSRLDCVSDAIDFNRGDKKTTEWLKAVEVIHKFNSEYPTGNSGRSITFEDKSRSNSYDHDSLFKTRRAIKSFQDSRWVNKTANRIIDASEPLLGQYFDRWDVKMKMSGVKDYLEEHF